MPINYYILEEDDYASFKTLLLLLTVLPAMILFYCLGEEGGRSFALA
ncbi:hypothetical protein [Sporolactobacillus inulinus]|uniref:Uncharacterized protein n=1 Tax=Sporolactobacillus inulinus TaxID=2078 RepID=A0A4Y3T1K9_9BACL|nr:hypothetical protein [Sporolactobacillus inulinus]GAY74648.1 hypothetical protein NBRC111894_202 [Sporolactobacillus inulinus]GEB75962.1 hypothetical protein SIN01_03070 [Sporolactobacillus inulinus]